MTPMMGLALTKVNVLRQLEANGAILAVPDLHRRLPGLTVEEIKDALRQLVAEGMVVVRFESTAQGKRFYVPPT